MYADRCRFTEICNVECSVGMLMARIKKIVLEKKSFNQSYTSSFFYFEVSCSMSLVRNILTEENNMTEASN